MILVVDLDSRTADVDERMRPRAVVAEPGRELECPLSPLECLLGVLREHGKLRQPAIGASELGGLAERFEDRNGLKCLCPCEGSLSGEPVQPRLDERATRDGRQLTQVLVDHARALDRGEGFLKPADEVRGRCNLFEHGRSLGRRQPAGEVRGAPVMRVRLAIRLQRRCPPRGDERVVGDDVLVARGFRVVDDVGRVCVRRQQRLEDLRVEAASRGDRQARPDRMPCQLVAEANVSRIDLEQRVALRLLRGRRPGRHHRVEQRSPDAAGHDRDQLDDAA